MNKTVRMCIVAFIMTIFLSSCSPMDGGKLIEDYKARISADSINRVQLSSEMIHNLSEKREKKIKDLLTTSKWEPLDVALHTEDYIVFDSGLVVGVVEADKDAASIVVDENKYKLNNLDANIYSLLKIALEDVIKESSHIFVGSSRYWDEAENILLVDAVKVLSGDFEEENNIDVSSNVNLSSDSGDTYVFFVAPSDDDRYQYKMLLYIEIDDDGYLKFGRTLDVQSFDLKENTVENLKDYIDNTNK